METFIEYKINQLGVLNMNEHYATNYSMLDIASFLKKLMPTVIIMFFATCFLTNL